MLTLCTHLCTLYVFILIRFIGLYLEIKFIFRILEVIKLYMEKYRKREGDKWFLKKLNAITNELEWIEIDTSPIENEE